MMGQLHLLYGKASIEFTGDQGQFAVLGDSSTNEAPLSDPDIGFALDNPIASQPLDDLVGNNDSVLIVVSDATRATASLQIVHLVVRRLIQSGVSAANISIIFATGIHRPVTQQEKIDLLSPFIVQRVRILDHDPMDQSRLSFLGVTTRGISVEVNRALKEFSSVVLTGGIGFHYFAGFTGGRKSICPGLASAKTIRQTHMLALDFQVGGRRAGVGAGLLEGNSVHEACDEIAELVAPVFAINSIVDAQKRAVRLFCGDWRTSHRAGCEYYLQKHSVEIVAKRDLVIVSCGGSPHDINLIQAHKALEMATHACTEGGSIILLAECIDGLGRPDFLKWFEAQNSRELENRLLENYEVNGQTAWSMLTKTERFKVFLVSSLGKDDVQKMRMTPSPSLTDALKQTNALGAGFILPRGAAVLPRLAALK